MYCICNKCKDVTIKIPLDIEGVGANHKQFSHRYIEATFSAEF